MTTLIPNRQLQVGRTLTTASARRCKKRPTPEPLVSGVHFFAVMRSAALLEFDLEHLRPVLTRYKQPVGFVIVRDAVQYIFVTGTV